MLNRAGSKSAHKPGAANTESSSAAGNDPSRDRNGGTGMIARRLPLTVTLVDHRSRGR